jgi:hypothetical protein
VVWLSNEIEILAALFEENRNEENAVGCGEVLFFFN